MSEVALEDGQDDVLPDEPESQEGDGEGVEIVLTGEDEPASQEVPKGYRKRINKLNERNRASEAEVERLRQENELLKLGQQPKPLSRPKLEDFDYDEAQHQRALDEYEDKRNEQMRESIVTEVKKAIIPTPKEDTTGLEAHYDRAEKLGLSDYEEAEDAVLEALGRNVFKAVASKLAKSELVVYHLGKNPGELRRIADLFEDDPAMATLALGEMHAALRARPRKKPTPQAEDEVNGDGGAAGGTWQDRVDAMRQAVADGDKSMDDLMALKNAARDEGASVR